MIKRILNMKDVKTHFDNVFGEDKWVITGSYAIYLLALLLEMDLSEELEPNNIDIMYHRNTPLATSAFLGYERVQNAPASSVTYVSDEYKDINATMTRSNIRFFCFGHMNIMVPTSLLRLYNDALEDNEDNLILVQKISLITAMIEKFSDDIIINNTRESLHLTPSSGSFEPLAKRLEF
jgi:hypothetical protein